MAASRETMDEIKNKILMSQGNVDQAFIERYGTDLFYNTSGEPGKFMKEVAPQLNNETMYNLTLALFKAHLILQQNEGLLRASGHLSGMLYEELAKRTGYDPWDKTQPIPEHFNVLNWYAHKSVGSLPNLKDASSEEIAKAAMRNILIQIKDPKHESQYTADFMEITKIKDVNEQKEATKALKAKDDAVREDPDRIKLNINDKVTGAEPPTLPEGYKFSSGYEAESVFKEFKDSEEKFIKRLDDIGDDERFKPIMKILEEKYPDAYRALTDMRILADEIMSAKPFIELDGKKHIFDKQKFSDYLEKLDKLVALSIQLQTTFSQPILDACNEYKRSMKREMRNDKIRDSVNKTIQEFSDIPITPTQRSMRHPLLFDELKKRLNKDDPRLADVNDANAAATSLAQGINQRKKDTEIAANKSDPLMMERAKDIIAFLETYKTKNRAMSNIALFLKNSLTTYKDENNVTLDNIKAALKVALGEIKRQEGEGLDVDNSFLKKINDEIAALRGPSVYDKLKSKVGKFLGHTPKASTEASQSPTPQQPKNEEQIKVAELKSALEKYVQEKGHSKDHKDIARALISQLNKLGSEKKVSGKQMIVGTDLYKGTTLDKIVKNVEQARVNLADDSGLKRAIHSRKVDQDKIGGKLDRILADFQNAMKAVSPAQNQTASAEVEPTPLRSGGPK